MIRVMLVDDHQMVRSAMRAVIERSEDIVIVGEADSGEAALARALDCAPHVILMDLSMPGMGGLEATRRLSRRLPGARVIALSGYVEEPYPSQMLAAGAAGYIGKDSDIGDVVKGIRKVHAGGRYISGEVAGNLAVCRGAGAQASPFEALSERESQVMMRIFNGDSLPVIAQALSLSPKTVSTYHRRILDKLGVHTDVELTLLAVRFGLLAEKLGDECARRRAAPDSPPAELLQ